MNTYDEYGEEELNDYNIQLTIQESSQEAFLKSADRHVLKRLNPAQTNYHETRLTLLCFLSLDAVTDENLRVLAAIEQGGCHITPDNL